MNDTKRTRLIDAAIEEFSERGVEGASYNKIIERSGLSKGTVYYYFDNKDSLLYTVLGDICERFENAIGTLELPQTKEEYWVAAWEYHNRAIRFFFENPSLSRIMFVLFGSDTRIDERLLAIHDRSTCFMKQLLLQGQKIGAVRSDLPVNTIQQLMHGAGKILSAAIVRESQMQDVKQDDATNHDAMQTKIKNFMLTMHDLSVRILTPGEVQDVR